MSQQTSSSPSGLRRQARDLDDPEVKKQFEAGKLVAQQLIRGIKTIGLYRHNESRFAEYLGNAHAALTQYHEHYGSLPIKVALTNFQLLGHDLFPEDMQLPYKFYRDGIRQLIFRQGFTIEELTTFTVIALSDPDRGADDLNAQLWRAQLPHFEFIMVEGFRMDEFGEGEVQVEVDRVVDYIQRRLRTNGEDYLRFARVTEHDLDMKLEDVEQMRGVVVKGMTADATLKARLQKEIHDEENQRLFPKLLSAVFQVVEAGVDDPELVSEMFTQLLDAMLLQEDFAIINQVVLKLRAMEQRGGPSSPAATLHRNFVAKMGEEQRISRLGEVLKFSRAKNAHDVVRYLANLTTDALPLLLDILEIIEVPENRTLLCDTFIPVAKENPEPFVSRLQSDKPQLVRDMIYVVDRANHPDKLKFFSTVLRSPNMALKLDVMAIIARGRTGEARRLIHSMLTDENSQVRMQAARVLSEFDRERGSVDLQRAIKDPSFEKKSRQEQEAFFAALGASGTASALAFLQQILAVKAGLFNREKVKQDKTLAVIGVALSGSPQTLKMLQDIIEDRDQPSEVQNQARFHVTRLKKAQSGNEKES